jgi:hypothetical protein
MGISINIQQSTPIEISRVKIAKNRNERNLIREDA